MAPSCSVAISSACHPISDDVDAALLPLQYYAIRTEDRARYVSFSSKEVKPLLH